MKKRLKMMNTNENNKNCNYWLNTAKLIIHFIFILCNTSNKFKHIQHFANLINFLNYSNFILPEYNFVKEANTKITTSLLLHKTLLTPEISFFSHMSLSNLAIFSKKHNNHNFYSFLI